MVWVTEQTLVSVPFNDQEPVAVVEGFSLQLLNIPWAADQRGVLVYLGHSRVLIFLLHY